MNPPIDPDRHQTPKVSQEGGTECSGVSLSGLSAFHIMLSTLVEESSLGNELLSIFKEYFRDSGPALSASKAIVEGGGRLCVEGLLEPEISVTDSPLRTFAGSLLQAIEGRVRKNSGQGLCIGVSISDLGVFGGEDLGPLSDQSAEVCRGCIRQYLNGTDQAALRKSDFAQRGLVLDNNSKRILEGLKELLGQLPDSQVEILPQPPWAEHVSSFLAKTLVHETPSDTEREAYLQFKQVQEPAYLAEVEKVLSKSGVVLGHVPRALFEDAQFGLERTIIWNFNAKACALESIKAEHSSMRAPLTDSIYTKLRLYNLIGLAAQAAYIGCFNRWPKEVLLVDSVLDRVGGLMADFVPKGCESSSLLTHRSLVPAVLRPKFYVLVDEGVDGRAIF